MTKSQRYTLLIDHKQHVSLWTRACRVNNWPKDDRDFRLQKLSEAVGRPIQSTSELNSTDDTDRVFDFLRSAADDLNATQAVDDPDAGRRRRLIYNIREVESELAAYPAHDPMGAEGVRNLVRSLCADIGNKGRSLRVEIKDVEDLSAKPITFTKKGTLRKIPSQLDQLLVTLNRMLGKYKKEEREWVEDEKRAQNEPDAQEHDFSNTEPVEENVPF